MAFCGSALEICRIGGLWPFGLEVLDKNGSGVRQQMIRTRTERWEQIAWPGFGLPRPTDGQHRGEGGREKEREGERKDQGRSMLDDILYRTNTTGVIFKLNYIFLLNLNTFFLHFLEGELFGGKKVNTANNKINITFRSIQNRTMTFVCI